MRLRLVLIIASLTTAMALAIMTAGTVILARQSDPAQIAFEAARKTEVVDRDIRAAIGKYRDVASRYASNRAVAANALLRMASCYEQLGRPEAKVTYQRLVREFADQAAPVAAARVWLGAGGAAAGQGGALTPRKVIADAPGTIQDVSADGRLAVFYGSGVETRDLLTNQTRTLIKRTITEGPVRPVLSPDGLQVVYTWLEQQTPGTQPATLSSLRIVGTTPGAMPRTLVAPDRRGGRTVALGWSPDGKAILAVVMSVTDGIGLSLAWVSVEHGAITTIRQFEEWRGIQVPNPNFGLGAPRLSPDGRSIAYSAFVREGSTERYIYVIDADGRNERAIVKTAGSNTDPVWAPDSTHVLFVGDRSGRRDLFAVAATGGGTMAEPVRLQTGFTGSPLAVSRSGDFLYGLADDSLNSSEFVATRDPAGSRIVQTFKGQSGMWSRGNKLAFVRLGQEEFELIVRSATSGEERMYRHPGIGLQSPRWLPDDGGLIVPIGPTGDEGRPGGSYYRLDVNTGVFTRLFARDTADHQRSPGVLLSHDGESFYTAVRRNAQSRWTGLVRVDLATGVETPFVTFPGTGLSVGFGEGPGLSLSPDGGMIAISHWVEGSRTDSRIMTVRSDGTDFREVHVFSGEHRTDLLRWTQDGQSLLFVAIKGVPGSGSWRMMRIPAAGGAAEFDGLDSTAFTSTLPLPPTIAGHISNFDVSPDGSHIVFATRTVATYDVWTIENIMSALSRR